MTLTITNNVRADLYLDGALYANSTTVVDAWHYNGTGDVNIGRRSDNANYFTGQIDDVRVYNRALSAAEVLTLYNQGK